ncbi:MAG: hypothetical protein ACOCXA_09690 [Planctomycetota bacterium]
MDERELNAYLMSLAQGCPFTGDPDKCQLQAFRQLSVDEQLQAFRELSPEEKRAMLERHQHCPSNTDPCPIRRLLQRGDHAQAHDD